MRIRTGMSNLPRWFLTIVFRETGSPNLCRLGANLISFGKRGIEHKGKLAYIQWEVTNETASVEFFPGACLLGVICDPLPGIDKQYLASLSPKDEVELVNPCEVVSFDSPQSKDILSSLGDERMWLEKQLRDKRGRKEVVQ